ncbi:kinase domain protein [Trichuris suis]|nr:kinase domain protein [Trichuris suis]
MPFNNMGDKLKTKRKFQMKRIEMPSGQPKSPSAPANLEDYFSFRLGEQEESIIVRAKDLVRIKELGRGGYGIVETMLHPETNTIFAVKRIHVTLNDEVQKRMLIELNASMKSGRCPFMVRFYGAMFREGDVWLCMEAMDTSLDKFYRMCIDLNHNIPEFFLSRVAFSIVEALYYMKVELNLMHRDVKPSNILLNRKGEVKICDFGISGHLTDSLAKTINAGCKPYMAPERINPQDEAMHAYDVRSDVWSLGITLVEVAIGNHPYAKWKTPFEQLKQVVMEPPPKLPELTFSANFCDFVSLCLRKNYRERPKYVDLVGHPFLAQREGQEADVSRFINEVLDEGAGNEGRLACTMGQLGIRNSLPSNSVDHDGGSLQA